MNCENNNVNLSNNENGLQENFSYQKEKTEISKHQFTDYRDALNGIIEDKDGFFRMNNLKLLSFNLVKDKKRIIPEFDKSKTVRVQRNSVDNLDLINNFGIKSFDNSDESNSDYIRKKKEYISKLIEEEINLQVVDLKWDLDGEIIFTQAYFKKNEFLYDDIISNYVILNSPTITTKNKKAGSLFSKIEAEATVEDDYGYYDCPTSGRKAISYYKVLPYILTSYFGGNVAEARAEITVTGSSFLENGNCKKVIESRSFNGYTYQSASGIADAEVQVTNFRAYTPYQQYDGYCEFVMAIVLQYKSIWDNVTISLSFSSASFTVSGGTGGTKVFEQYSGYVIPSMLN
ncbi:hypothetical protein [Flavobacterium daejeonense]|uniref:hypothetical protein n=1 Tax=Flavobacterium daejeonense TaxID=350893 RepID=UPI00047A0666|nr:hypothetical protein [Flavobacterium daejeonense]